MSVSELNHFMTYVIDGWMLFSAGFIGIAFTSFVSRRIQEDIAAETAALAQGEAQGEEAIAPVSTSKKVTAIQPAAEVPASSPTHQAEATDHAETEEDAARLEEVAAVSEKLSKTKEKQSGSSSVSVST